MSTSRVITSPIGPTGPAGPVNLYQGTAAGTNTYTTTAAPVPSAYTANDLYVVTFTNGNTGASTLNANGLGANAIQFNGAALVGGEIIAGETWVLKYDGTQFQMTAESFGQRRYIATSTSGTTTYTATLAPVPSAYQFGCQYTFTVTNTNIGAVTMNFNSLGAKTVLLNGAALQPGQFQAGVTYQAVFDGTNLQITNQTISTTDIDSRFVSVIADDLFYGPVTGPATQVSSYLSWGFAFGTLSGIAQSSNTEGAGMAGALTMTTGNATNGYVGINSLQGTSSAVPAPPFYIGNSQLEITWWFKTDATLSNGTDRYLTFVGLADSVANPSGSATCVMLAYRDDINSGNWFTQVKIAGVSQTNAFSTVPYTASTFYVIKMIVNAAGTSADFYITTYGNAFPVTPDVSYTGTFPPQTVALAAQLSQQKQAGATPRKLYADRWQVVTRVVR